MIKIELNNKKDILEFHYKNLTKKKGNVWVIETFLKNRIKKFSNPVNQHVIDLYEYLLLKTIMDTSGYSILTTTIDLIELERLHIESNFQNALSTTYSRDAKTGKITTVREDLLKVYYYGSYDKWKAYELAKKINVKVCPYCNRNFTFIVGSDKIKGTRFQYDHFYDKARYPYLALSFFNLIPSCNVCNSDLKGTTKFNFEENIHPYTEGFGNNLLFTINPKSVNFINGKTSAYRIRYRMSRNSKWSNQKTKAALRNISVFELSKLYNMHKDYVDEIIQKSIVYNQEYIEELFEKYKGDLFHSIDDVKRMVVGNYINESDFSKRPLSKLTADIARELNLI